jgi:hypothetical protein
MSSQEIWVSNPLVLLDKNHIHELWPKEGTSTEAKLNAGTRLVIILSILGYLVTMNVNFFIIGFITLVVIGGLYTVGSTRTQIGDGKEKTDMEGMQQGSGEGDGTGKEGFVSDGRGKLSDRPAEFENPEPRESYGYDRKNVHIKGNFVPPSTTNPLMNVLLPEIQYTPSRGGAMPAFAPQVETSINENAKQYISTNFDASARDVVSAEGSSSSSNAESEARDIYNKLFSNLGDNFEFDQSMRSFYATANTRVNNDQRAFAEFCYGDMVSCKEGDEFACSRHNTRIGQVIGA